MKRTLLILLVLLLSLIGKSQSVTSNRHVSMADCGGDTLRYFRTNFIEHKDRYIGLKVDSLFKDLEFSIVYFVPITDNNKRIYSLMISYTWGAYHEQVGKNYYILMIDFEEDVEERLWNDVTRQWGNVYWKEDHRNFFKDLTIKDVLVFKEPKHKRIEK